MRRRKTATAAKRTASERRRSAGESTVEYAVADTLVLAKRSLGHFVTALGLSEDLKEGAHRPFSLAADDELGRAPGRTLADIVSNVVQLVVMVVVGLIVGFTFYTGVPEVVAGILLCLLIGYAFSWVFAFVGLTASAARSPVCRAVASGDDVSAAPCTHLDTIQVTELPDPPLGCEECLKIDSSWVHLRMCLGCGKVGCCDNSPNRHATAHFHESGHPLIRSAEPGEDWSWCYVDEVPLALRV